MPTQSLDRGTSYGQVGMNVSQAVWQKLNYKGWAALGDDVIYSADKRLAWFQTRQGVQYQFKNGITVEGGYAFHYIWNVPGLMAHDNGVYARLDYKLW
jgi:hypothetical protein